MIALAAITDVDEPPTGLGLDYDFEIDRLRGPLAKAAGRSSAVIDHSPWRNS